MSENIQPIVEAFNQRYQSAWGSDDILDLYCDDGVMIAEVTAIGKPAIRDLLKAIFAQGWKLSNVRTLFQQKRGDVIIVTVEYLAQSGEDTSKATASQVLVNENGTWKTAMHTNA
ncbi:nuclear transport factor 2 family protein [Henriciella sp. AS95]|uniref:YybH family protein n=1 Tax=Henriciella sp. AS95 TaxID=3135782 RepID=UPI003181EEC9